MDKGYFGGKKVLVMGLGRFGGGVDVAKFACEAGAKVTVTDLATAEKLKESVEQLKEFAGIEYHLGSHEAADFEKADIVIANPAVPDDNKFLEAARKAGRVVTSQIGTFFELCPAVIIGITGTNGKSTTTALTAHLLRAGLGQKNTIYKKVWLSGNIGNEPLLTTIEQIEQDDLVVLELSSFQIEQLARFDLVRLRSLQVAHRKQIPRMPKVVLLTNLTPNHLDRYGTFENYFAAKENIFKFQKLDEKNPAVSIFNAEDEIAAEWFSKYEKDRGRICIKFSSDEVDKKMKERFGLPGGANLSNLAAAAAIARYFGVGDERIKKCLPEFKALPHRLELVAEIKGVRWYNDSKATTPDSTMVALEAFEQPEIIIAGGYDKQIPFDELGEKIAQKAKAAILIGQTAKKIAEAIKVQKETSVGGCVVKLAGTLAEAVQTAKELAVSGDVVLLSTACASYDMFENYEQRGSQFIELVRRIGDLLSDAP